MIFRISKEDNPAIYNTVYRYFSRYQNVYRNTFIPLYINYKNPTLDERFQKYNKLENGNFESIFYTPFIYFLQSTVEDNVVFAIPFFSVVRGMCDAQGNPITEYEGKKVEQQLDFAYMYLGDPDNQTLLNEYIERLKNLATDDAFLSKIIGVEKELSASIYQEIHAEILTEHYMIISSPISKNCPFTAMPERGAICLYDVQLYEVIHYYSSVESGVDINGLQYAFRTRDVAKDLFKAYIESNYDVFKIFSGQKKSNNPYRDNLDVLLSILTFSKDTPLDTEKLEGTYPPLPSFSESVMKHILSGNIPMYFQVASSIERKEDINKLMDGGNDNISQASISQCYFIDPMLPFKDIIQNKIRNTLAKISANIAVNTHDPIIQTANSLCPSKGIVSIPCNKLYTYFYTGLTNQDAIDGQFRLMTLPIHVYYVLLQHLFKQTYGQSVDMNIVEFLCKLIEEED